MDKLTPEHRSWNMGRIRSGNTKPELAVRSLLHRMGYRFRLHRKDLPGKPDIILPKYKTVVFVHGCFWHRHMSCQYAYAPKSRVKFWEEKFKSNIERDNRNQAELEAIGWKVIVIWECELSDTESVVNKLTLHIKLKKNNTNGQVDDPRDSPEIGTDRRSAGQSSGLSRLGRLSHQRRLERPDDRQHQV
jgi:DNA mismatch endonuclease (patch repair protein)